VLIAWDPLSGKACATLKAHSKFISHICWEPLHRNAAGERLVTCSKDSLVKIWNLRTKSCEKTLAGHVGSIECVLWSGEGILYSASRDRTIKVWDDGGKLIRTLQGHAHRVNTLALSSDYICRTGPFDPMHYQTYTSSNDAYQIAVQKYNAFKGALEPERLVSGSDDCTLIFWHPLVSKHPIKRLTGHQLLINHIAFSPDARFFCSASFDKKIKLWDGKTADYLVTLTGHVGAVYRVAWSADSRHLVSASKDSTVKLWAVDGSQKKESC